MRYFLFSFLLLLPVAARAGEPQLTGQYQSWQTYHYQENGTPVCYAMTRAESTKDAKGHRLEIKSRGKVLLQVTHRANEGGGLVVSYVAGQSIKRKTPVLLQTDKSKFRMRGDGDTAWTENAAMDADVVKALRNAKWLAVVHQDRKGVPVTDAFALKGAGNALTAISKCE